MMNFSTTAPNRKQQLLEKVMARLSTLCGLQAVVLGGSYARGTQRPDSDLDLGISFFDADPFPIDEIRQAAEEIAVSPPTVTGFYAWGRWVNGGAWIQTSAGQVDLLYCSLDPVRATIADFERGAFILFLNCEIWKIKRRRLEIVPDSRGCRLPLSRNRERGYG